MTKASGQLIAPVGADDHIQGDARASVTLLEFGDYECPHCGRAYLLVKRVQDRLGDKMRFAFRNFPLAEAHPHANAAAELAEGAALQGKFWQMHDTLFEHQDALESDDLLGYARALTLDIAKLQAALDSGIPQERVRADFMSGARSGVNGTPTFFLGGYRFDGNWTDEDEFVAALEAAAQRR
jgi:protein-disulfide isomerase